MWVKPLNFLLGITEDEIWSVNPGNETSPSLPLLDENSNRFSSHCGPPDLSLPLFLFSHAGVLNWGLSPSIMIIHLLVTLCCLLVPDRWPNLSLCLRLLGRRRKDSSSLNPILGVSPLLKWPTIPAFQKVHFVINIPNLTVDSQFLSPTPSHLKRPTGLFVKRSVGLQLTTSYSSALSSPVVPNPIFQPFVSPNLDSSTHNSVPQLRKTHLNIKKSLYSLHTMSTGGRPLWLAYPVPFPLPEGNDCPVPILYFYPGSPSSFVHHSFLLSLSSIPPSPSPTSMEDVLASMWSSLSLTENESITLDIDPNKLYVPKFTIIGKLAMRKH